MNNSPDERYGHADPDPEPSTSGERHGLSRRAFAGGAAAATSLSLLGGRSPSSAAAATGTARRPTGFGSVSAAPRLPAGFTKTFRSRYVQANGIRQHVVIGGDGPPLLLVHGWPENWYAWRFVMPALAQHFTVVAADQRGIGLSEKATSGYDSATVASDMAALMTELGHGRFSVVGHDTGYVISYALAADHRDRVDRVALAEIPGPPGIQENPADPPPPPMFVPEALNNKLWHIPFNRVDDELVIDMVKSNANAYYRYEYTVQGGAGPALPDHAIDYYIKLYTRDRTTLRASFGHYRAWDSHLAQNVERQATPLTIPVLGIGGEHSWGPAAAHGIEPAAPGVETAVIPGAGHWVAEQNPSGLVDVLLEFLLT
jgi:pimeloyl-ACP methyl ester carboxylesterase